MSFFGLAEAYGVALTSQEQRITARFFFNGVADAATEYSHSRDGELREQAQKHLGFLAHELRNPLASARLAMSVVVRGGDVPKPRLLDSVARGLTRMSTAARSVRRSRTWYATPSSSPAKGELSTSA